MAFKYKLQAVCLYQTALGEDNPRFLGNKKMPLLGLVKDPARK